MTKHQVKVYRKALRRTGKWFHGVDRHNPLSTTEIVNQLEAETRYGKDVAIWRQKEYGL